MHCCCCSKLKTTPSFNGHAMSALNGSGRRLTFRNISPSTTLTSDFPTRRTLMPGMTRSAWCLGFPGVVTDVNGHLQLPLTTRRRLLGILMKLRWLFDIFYRRFSTELYWILAAVLLYQWQLKLCCGLPTLPSCVSFLWHHQGTVHF